MQPTAKNWEHRSELEDDMTSRLSQLHAQYDNFEDRIVLAVSTTDRAEFKFWLTRHFVRKLWPSLVRALSSDPVVQTQASEQGKKALLSFQHSSAVEDTNFSKPYEDNAVEQPLGDEPLLAASAHIKAMDDGTEITLGTRDGKGLEIALNPRVLHSLCKLLQDTSEQARWGLDLVVGEEAAPVEARGMLN